MQARHHELPQLPHRVRGGEHEREQAGHLEVLPERFGRRQKDERDQRQIGGNPCELPGDKHVLKRNAQPLHQRIGVKEGPDEHEADDDDRSGQPDLELDQVLHDRHLLVFQRREDRVLQPLPELRSVSHQRSAGAAGSG